MYGTGLLPVRRDRLPLATRKVYSVFSTVFLLLLFAHFWLGLSWIDSISAKQRFSSSKTSSRKPYTYSKQQEKQKHSAENTINFSISFCTRGSNSLILSSMSSSECKLLAP